MTKNNQDKLERVARKICHQRFEHGNLDACGYHTKAKPQGAMCSYCLGNAQAAIEAIEPEWRDIDHDALHNGDVWIVALEGFPRSVAMQNIEGELRTFSAGPASKGRPVIAMQPLPSPPAQDQTP